MLIEILDRRAEEDSRLRYGSKKKTSFWASEADKMAFDIYHKWMDTPETNPIEGQTLIMLQMRKLTEVALVELLRTEGILIEEYSNNTRCYFEWGPHKVPISGYPDAGVIGPAKIPAVVEIKTYYGNKNQADVSAGRVRVSYLVQLAIYMYHLKEKHGILFMVNQGTGQKYEYDLYQDEKNEYLFLCPDNEMEINLLDVFKRWEKIYVENILKKVEPEIEFIYKYDIEKMDWENTPASKISKARNNHAVIGDYQVKYSSYKDIIVERQGTQLGYSDEETARICELTKGYSTRAKSKNEVRFDPSQLT